MQYTSNYFNSDGDNICCSDLYYVYWQKVENYSEKK